MAGAAARGADIFGPPKENKTRTIRLDEVGPPGRILSELADDGCRFPVGEATGRLQMFCGRQASVGPYCAKCAPRTRIAGSAMSRDEANYWAAVAKGAR